MHTQVCTGSVLLSPYNRVQDLTVLYGEEMILCLLCLLEVSTLRCSSKAGALFFKLFIRILWILLRNKFREMWWSMIVGLDKESHFFFQKWSSHRQQELIYIFFWLPWAACGILVPWPGIEPGPSAVKVLSPNHWTSRKFPKTSILNPIGVSWALLAL